MASWYTASWRAEKTGKFCFVVLTAKTIGNAADLVTMRYGLDAERAGLLVSLLPDANFVELGTIQTY